MPFDRLLTPDCTHCDLGAASKKRALELAAESIAERNTSLDAREVFEALMARERLGSTAVGHGVAIPHCRLDGCTAPVAALVRLATAIDFDAPDGEPVDLLFVLVVPGEAHEEHLQLLASAARALNDPAYRAALREAGSDLDLFETALYSRRGDGRADAANG
ncbi:MAG: PTS sugar transporter subunit IIA [Pseudomonadales bacterium]|nr:PTS sugar transporter subunit IIA [Pseudomonadales bacterium]